MEPQYIENTVNFKDLFHEVRRRWYLFVVSLILIAPLAYIYLSFTEKSYEVNSSILVKKHEVGSFSAYEAITPLDARYIERDRSIVIQDEISKLKSDDLIRQTLSNLNFSVSYYTVESFWPDFLKEKWLNELYEEAPFSVEIDSSANQLVEMLVHIYLDSNGQIMLDIQGEDAYLYNFKQGRFKGNISEVNIHSAFKPGERWQNEYFAFSIIPKDGFQVGQDYYFKLHTGGALANQFKKNLSVELAQSGTSTQESRVIRLGLQTNIPTKGSLFLNELISTYINNDILHKNEKGRGTIKFLDENILKVEDSLELAKNALQYFKVKSNVIDINNRKLLGMSQLSSFEEERTLLENNLAYYRKSLADLNEEEYNLVTPSSVGIEDGVFEKLIADYISIKTRANQVLNYENENNPLVEQLNMRLKSLQEEVKKSLENSIILTEAKLNSLNKRTNRLEVTMSSLPGNEQQLAELEKNYNYYLGKYDYLVSKKAESELALATNAPDIDIINSVKVKDEPIAPNNQLVFLVAIFLACMLPFVIILPIYFTKEKLVDKKDLEKQTEIPLLGMIASGPKDSKLIVQRAPNSVTAESFAYIRINLHNFFKDKPNQLIGITSSIEGEGKTFCAANLAYTLAEAGLKTLLIEGDFRRPKLSGYFKKVISQGISNYLEQDFEYQKIIQPTPFKNLDVVFAGSSDSSPIKLMEQPKMAEFLNQVRQKYDKIIIDTPPVGLVADYLVLQRYFDVNIFVVRYNYTSRVIIKGINEVRNNNNIDHVYLILNDVEAFSGYGNIKDSNNYYIKNVKRKKVL